MRIVFMGTPEFAVESLKSLVEANFDVATVVTVPDKPSGRGQKIQESAVKQYAKTQGLLVLQPKKMKDPEFLKQLQELHADLFVVVAFRMLPESVWDMPPLGTINLHASLLPDYRGAAPINWVLINGETRTGTTVFFIDKEIDTGNIISREECVIDPNDNAGSLHDKLMHSGAKHLTGIIQKIGKKESNSIPQQDLISGTLHHAPKIFRETCKIRWDAPAQEIHNLVRGLSPYPVAWTTIVTPKEEHLTLKIYETGFSLDPYALAPGTIKSNGNALQIATCDGWIEVKKLQLEGKKSMSTADFLRGVSDITKYKIICDF